MDAYRLRSPCSLNKIRPAAVVRKSFCPLTVLLFLLIPLGLPALAQSKVSEAQAFAAEVIDRHLATSYVHELDRTAAWIAYIEGVAIMGELQSWTTEKNFEEGSLRSFVYDVHNLEARLVPAIVAIKRDAARNKVFKPDEQALFDEILEDVGMMVSASQDLYALLQEGRVEEAGEFYRSQTRTLFRKIQGDTYTLTSSIERELKKARLKIRSLE